MPFLTGHRCPGQKSNFRILSETPGAGVDLGKLPAGVEKWPKGTPAPGAGVDLGELPGTCRSSFFWVLTNFELEKPSPGSTEFLRELSRGGQPPQIIAPKILFRVVALEYLSPRVPKGVGRRECATRSAMFLPPAGGRTSSDCVGGFGRGASRGGKVAKRHPGTGCRGGFGRGHDLEYLSAMFRRRGAET